VITTPRTCRSATLKRGVTLSVIGLQPFSKITVALRLGTHSLRTYRLTADRIGAAKLKIKLTSRQADRARRRILLLRFKLTAANQVRHSPTRRLTIT
jgi:hypothetical protein